MVLCNVLLLLQCGSKGENIHYIVGFFWGGGAYTDFWDVMKCFWISQNSVTVCSHNNVKY